MPTFFTVSRLIRNPQLLREHVVPFMLATGPCGIVVGAALAAGLPRGHGVLGFLFLLGGLLTSYSVTRLLTRAPKQ